MALFGPAGEAEDQPVAMAQPLEAALLTLVTRRYGVIFVDTDV
ncbi:MAG: hypothetical protein ACT4OS_05090 [Acidimicrobiales bacterium]